MTDVEDRLDEFEERLERLESEVDGLNDRFQGWRKETVNPKIEAIEDRSDDARADRAELRETVKGLEDLVSKFQFTLEQLKGLGETETTSPAARVRDLRADMIDEVEALGENDGVQLWWKEVQSLFARHGHGEVKAPECHKAMEEAATADGFELTKKVNENGNQVKAIRLKSAALPATSAVSDPTNAESVSAASTGGDTPSRVNQD